jgi:hypothetical protein
VFKGFLDGQNDADLDGDAVPDGVELWVNLIDYMLPVIVQARSRVGAGDVWAVGDGGLFSDEDPDNDGTMSLYEYDNARLARNVFAFGRMCQECRVALFKDQDPWGFGAHYGASSAGLAEAVYDEALLDEAGNLPAEAPAAAIGPLATGDVVNSIPSPAGGFIGLEWIDGFLWATSEFTAELYKLAPGDGTILQTIPLPTVYPCGLAWDGSTFWIPDCAADVIVQMDMAGTVLRSFPAPGSGSVGLAWDGAYLWDVDYDSDELHQIDPFTGAVVHTIPAPDTRPAGVAWDGQYLWTNGRDSMTTYQVNPADGSVMASFTTPPGTGGNNGQGAAFDGLYLWVAHFEEQTIYQVDVEHVRRWPEPNEQVLRAWGIPYDVFSSVDVGAIDLSPYCKVIVASQQPADFYKTLSINRAWFEAWIEAGGMFEFHGACQDTDDWSGLPMPGGFTKAWDPWDDVTIIDYAHPIIVGPNAVSDAEVDHWSASTHGYLVDLPRSANEIIAHEPSGEPATAEFRLGGGCVVATDQPLEWAWYFRRSAILENVIAHQECLPARVYLPLVLRNWP